MRGRATLLWLLVATGLVAAIGGCNSSAASGQHRLTMPHTGITLPGTFEASATVLQDRSHGPQLCLGGVATSLPPQCGGPDIPNWDWAQAPSKESAAGATWTEAHVVGFYDGRQFRLTERPGPPQPEPSPSRGADFSPGCAHPKAGTDPQATEADVRFGPLEQWIVAEWVSDPSGPGWKGPFTLTVVVKPGHAEQVERAARADFHGYLCVVEHDAPSRRELSNISEEVLADRAMADRAMAGTLGASVDEQRGVVEVVVAVATDDIVKHAYERWGDKVALSGLLRPVGRGGR
jgi:hypothetical protein